VFEIERTFPNSVVQCIAVYTGNDESLWQLSQKQSEVGAFQLIKQGNLRVGIHFAEAFTTTINVIMFAEFDNVIEIDRNRQVLFDNST
jgi:hypothetical protein